jgi:hypothetical protein
MQSTLGSKDAKGIPSLRIGSFRTQIPKSVLSKIGVSLNFPCSGLPTFVGKAEFLRKRFGSARSQRKRLCPSYRVVPM